jgi:hypothetical protein
MSYLAKVEVGEEWCPESDLNQRPIAYEAIALPLSYRGIATCIGRGPRPALPLSYRVLVPASAARGDSRASTTALKRMRAIPPVGPNTNAHGEFS